jgi:hypothetical protein
MINVTVMRKCLGLLCAVLLSGGTSQPCSSAALITLSLKSILWSNGVPRSDVTTSSDRNLRGDISAADLSQLSSHDVVLIIDKSHSMTKKDCLQVSQGPEADSSIVDDQLTAPISRWEWCREQTLDLTEKTQGILPEGVSIVLFSGEYLVFNNIDAKLIGTIFTNYTPKGSTNTTAALKSQLDQYFRRRGHLGQGTKPLLIAVITDGCPDDPSKLRYTIVDATRQMKTSGEILITFLQVGNDPSGGKLLEELDNRLVERKAQFDIVDVVPYTEMRKIGLTRALVSAIVKR